MSITSVGTTADVLICERPIGSSVRATCEARLRRRSGFAPSAVRAPFAKLLGSQHGSENDGGENDDQDDARPHRSDCRRQHGSAPIGGSLRAYASIP
jgi:hypothetical protein